ncbi:uncharacterized protein RSE6_07532 [Rhynchosporium secalis]|uniref:NadR/Ttd14 AAA domain-containing protein n=1 Tax=Rhynchosporium secalis TaxID=38038 RepID=A0A1E1MD27_RHYSE|nr:uncharacterized protein RSE6_07532 [Rhynchosporium secalis]
MMPEERQPPNIYIVGAQCTGKTTLVKALEHYFSFEGNLKIDDENLISRPQIITEVARSVLKQHSFIADDITSSPTRALALQKLILKAQVQAEAQASTTHQDTWFISDRSGADPIVYAKEYVSDVAANDLLSSPEWLEMKRGMEQSLVVVCEAGADWLIDDNVRLMPESKDAWTGFHQLFCACLDTWGVNYGVLPCAITAHQDRINFVLEQWLAKQAGGNRRGSCH